ncbi:MAG: TetR/AcrR family transcriptional regulator [Eubacteriales bacterium]|nr:TetR/AcrR family transcriptional regulator [Eubacteriales bacterium]
MMNEIQDERYYIADEAIYDAFLLVLKEKEIDKITVSDIIKRAGIVRSTFYNHYENIPALITAIEDKTIQDIFTLMETFHPKNDRDICKSYFLTICDYTMTNPFLANLLRSPRGDAFFEKIMTMFHRYVKQVTQNTIPAEHSKDEFSYMIACTIGSTLGVLHKWTKENFQVPKEVVADILTQAFIAGMLPFMS